MFHKLRYPFRAVGISNLVRNKKADYSFGLQFYDYDGILHEPIIRMILGIFPYDCICYQTRHGYHFISFTLSNFQMCRERAISLTNEFREYKNKQDYRADQPDLILRVSPKWKVKRNGTRLIKSEKPKFCEVLSYPLSNIPFSQKHLDFYFRYMNLPKKIYKLYNQNIGANYSIMIYHYRTRRKDE